MKKRYKGPAGFRQFGKDFSSWARKDFVRGHMPRALLKAMTVVVGEAKKRCPVETGKLRRSIQYRGPHRTGKGCSGSVGSDEPYAPYIEFGTKYIHVGTPAAPDTDWPAKWSKGRTSGSVGGQETMPYLRAAIYAKRQAVMKALKTIGST